MTFEKFFFIFSPRTSPKETWYNYSPLSKVNGAKFIPAPKQLSQDPCCRYLLLHLGQDLLDLNGPWKPNWHCTKAASFGQVFLPPVSLTCFSLLLSSSVAPSFTGLPRGAQGTQVSSYTQYFGSSPISVWWNSTSMELFLPWTPQSRLCHTWSLWSPNTIQLSVLSNLWDSILLAHLLFLGAGIVPRMWH